MAWLDALVDALWTLVRPWRWPAAVRNHFSPRTVRNLRNELDRSFLATLGIALVTVAVLMAVFAPLAAPWNPTKNDIDNKQQPPLGFTRAESQTTSEMVNGSVQIVNETVLVNATAAHPMGTDALGRDMLSRVIYGARTSLVVGVAGTLLAMLLGVPTGLVSGYFSGRVDDAVMRIADISLAFPSLVLAVALVGLWGQASVTVPDPFVVTGLSSVIRGAISLPGAAPSSSLMAGAAPGRSQAMAV